MRYTYLIRNNATGEQRTYTDEWDDPEVMEFCWTDGNYACDCNRALFFSRAGGEPELEVPCGSTAFTVLMATDENGQSIQIDHNPEGDHAT